MSLLIVLLLPFVGSLIVGLLPSGHRNAVAWVAGAVAAVGLALVMAAYPAVARGDTPVYQVAWIPMLGVNFSLHLDGFAWLFAFLVLAIGLLVILYARFYMSPQDPVPRFFAFLLVFMGAMLGLVLSANLIQLVLFWELTSLASFMLIGYWHHNADARRGARMALIITGTGGLALFAGMLMLGHVVGSFELATVLQAGDVVRAHPWYGTILGLVLLGAFTKSAQFPFHFWLPRAMAAPTPVSAYLHSATMVKAGVFLLARFWPVLAGTPEWFWLVGGVGLVTLLLGAYAAVFQQDLKGLLAYSTISHLGLITLLLGLNSPLAVVAAVFHILNHATFKAALFMTAGVIDHETGTRDLRRLSGLAQAMPITATLAMVTGAAMAGVPLLNGFLSKEMFFTETLSVAAADWVRLGLPVLATLAGILGVIYSLRFVLDVFRGPPATDLPRSPHEPPRLMRLPIEVLAVACVLVGVAPFLVQGLLQVAAASVVRGPVPGFTVAIWHGWNLPLLMSLMALVVGWLSYRVLHRCRALEADRVPLIYRLDGRSTFEASLNGLGALADALMHQLDTQRLQPQLLWMLGMALLVGAYPFFIHPLQFGSMPLTPLEPGFGLIWLAGAICTLGAAWQARFHRLAALMLMGGAGLVTCVTFVWFSAPDLALTQLMVEVVTMVLILLGLRWLPILKRDSDIGPGLSRRLARRSRDLLIAVAAGSGMAVLAFAILTRDFEQSISPYFLARAESEGGGTNVVNVILVDFRGFDTMGELTVVGIVALIVYALLRRFRPAPESLELPTQQRVYTGDGAQAAAAYRSVDAALTGYLRVPAVLARLLLPVLLLVGIYLLLRGHNLPGGGFVAGLITAVALTLQYMVGGALWVEKNLSLKPLNWIAVGLLLAAGTGLGAWVFGYPFLTSHTAHPVLPWLGEIPLASALFFDLGVFALVVGSTLLILIALAHQSVRSHRAAASAEQAAHAAEGGSWN